MKFNFNNITLQFEDKYCHNLVQERERVIGGTVIRANHVLEQHDVFTCDVSVFCCCFFIAVTLKFIQSGTCAREQIQFENFFFVFFTSV